MAPANPNPARISEPLWKLWVWFSQLEPDAKLGGIYAAKTGYHDIRNAVSPYDYSVGEVAADRQGPGDKASAIDLTMGQDDMRKYTARLDTAVKRRDERLWIGGVPILREFIGTKNNSSVYCYVLTGGFARGLGADAGEDWGRDPSHLWHLHLSIIRRWCADAAAMDRLFSVLNNEPITAWRARTRPPVTVQEDDMNIIPIPIPAGFAYEADEDFVEGKPNALSIPLPAVGHKDGHVKIRDKALFVSLAGDHAAQGSPPAVRVAINNGSGWTVKTVPVASGGRVGVPVPAAANGTAYNVTVGRVASDVAAHETLPLSVLIEIL